MLKSDIEWWSLKRLSSGSALTSDRAREPGVGGRTGFLGFFYIDSEVR